MSEQQGIDQAFEREKWEALERRLNRELELREREVTSTEKEINLREKELSLKITEIRHSRWFNPLVLAVLAAALAGIANAFIAWLNGENQLRLELTKNSEQRAIEEAKAEHARVLEAIRASDLTRASANLKLLVDSGLIGDRNRQLGINNYLTRMGNSAPASATVAAAPASSTMPVMPEPSASAAVASQPAQPQTVPYTTGWLGGGHNQRDSCDQGRAIISARFPGRQVVLISSGERNKKDFFGRVEYQYYCDFEVR